MLKNQVHTTWSINEVIMMLPLLTKIGILFFAESPSSPEAEVDPGEGGIVVAVLDGFVRIVLVLESHETVVVTEIK